jgi:gamma-glutamyltranspeptidase/glutathione hydrolase
VKRLTVAVLLSFFALAAAAAEPRPGGAAIATAHPLATAAGREILQQGGNAFDAAVAIAAALAVVEPTSSGLGGGGFWLLHRAHDNFDVMVDARERAPLAARADMYLDVNGNPRPRLSLDGPLAAAIPGTPAALVHVAEHYGRFPLAKSLEPAIRLALDGFVVSARYEHAARRRLQALQAYPAAAAVFLEHGEVPKTGYALHQRDLARVLRTIAENGRDGFYAGATAQRLVEGVRAAGGIWTLKDLSAYRVVERPPLSGHYRGVRITAASLPSSGGVVLLEMLNILQGYKLDVLKPAERSHLIIEAMRRAYRDRACYLGDPDFVTVDTKRLLDRAYADAQRVTIHVDRATRSDSLPACEPAASGPQTTHFSVIDRDGNRVAATLTINTAFGSAFVPPGTGVLLNNEMDDFVVKPGVPNTYGLVGGSANAIAPGKRPLSSMTPTFVESPRSVVVLGTPGGSRIITMVLLVTLDIVRNQGGPHEWVARPRFHHQYLPDEVMYESGAFDASEIEQLQAMGHRLKAVAPYGNMQIVAWDRRTRTLQAASDPRGEGLAWVER